MVIIHQLTIKLNRAVTRTKMKIKLYAVIEVLVPFLCLLFFLFKIDESSIELKFLAICLLFLVANNLRLRELKETSESYDKEKKNE